MEMNIIYNMDCLEGLKSLKDDCVDCCVTSPPYYGLRDYGVEGQIGLEETPEEYIEKLKEVFMEVYRVLKPSGSLWLNIGDSYWSGKRKHQIIKQKDIIGIPWILAFELRKSGWYLRQDIIWAKTNNMPESVKDRFTKSHEYIFLLTKSSKYYFDHEAALEPASYDGRKDTMHKGSDKYAEGTTGLPVQTFASKGHERWPNKIRGYANKEGETGLTPNHHGSNIQTLPARNKRDIWSIPTKAEKESHFAVFPEKLIVDCIKIGCPEGGIVIDPFMGSGTTAVVARKLNRNFIGFELNPKYIEISNSKIERELGFFK